MAVEPHAGKRFIRVTKRRTKQDWARFVEELATHYQHAEKITLVMDNLNIHSAGSLYETFRPEQAKKLWDRFEFIFTPRHGSWLNMAEIELNILVRQCLSRRIASIEEMKELVNCWQGQRNMNGAKIDWQFTTEQARIKLQRLYPTFVK